MVIFNTLFTNIFSFVFGMLVIVQLHEGDNTTALLNFLTFIAVIIVSSIKREN